MSYRYYDIIRIEWNQDRIQDKMLLQRIADTFKIKVVQLSWKVFVIYCFQPVSVHTAKEKGIS